MTNPAGAVTRGRGRSPFLAIVAYTLRVCIPARRRGVLALPCAAAVLFGFLASASNDPAPEAFATVADIALFGLVVPLGCLVLGDAVLGAEVRGGTLPFTWLSPVPFGVITAGRWLGGWLVALATLVPASVLAALVANAPESAPGAAVATAVGSGAYIALFVMIGATVQRAAVWSLAVVFLVERLLGTALSGIAQLSPMWEMRAVFADLAPDADELVRDGIPQGTAAIVRLVLIGVAALGVATWRLRHLRLAGSSD